MIRLFRHDGLELMLNVDMIKEIHAGPPTVLILIDGERIQVKNKLGDVMIKIRAWRQGLEAEDNEFDPEARHKKGQGRKPPVR
ncbi:MAG: flagellar FlbD family protein [Candidatus Aminicenantes bacterium]|nr:flagellar FlbD family protein [Candidatus Aminicenantes bacterium]